MILIVTQMIHCGSKMKNRLMIPNSLTQCLAGMEKFAVPRCLTKMI
jgi:hypothetical protein